MGISVFTKSQALSEERNDMPALDVMLTCAEEKTAPILSSPETDVSELYYDSIVPFPANVRAVVGASI